MDANEHALNKHMYKQEKYESACECFSEAVKDALDAIAYNVEFIKSMSADYQGFDMSEYAEECIKEVI